MDLTCPDMIRFFSSQLYRSFLLGSKPWSRLRSGRTTSCISIVVFVVLRKCSWCWTLKKACQNWPNHNRHFSSWSCSVAFTESYSSHIYGHLERNECWIDCTTSHTLTPSVTGNQNDQEKGHCFAVYPIKTALDLGLEIDHRGVEDGKTRHSDLNVKSNISYFRSVTFS